MDNKKHQKKGRGMVKRPNPSTSQVGYFQDDINQYEEIPQRRPMKEIRPRKGGNISERQQLVKEIMAEQGLTMTQASKYIKQHQLY